MANLSAAFWVEGTGWTTTQQVVGAGTATAAFVPWASGGRCLLSYRVQFLSGDLPVSPPSQPAPLSVCSAPATNIGVFRAGTGQFILNSESTNQLSGSYNYANAAADGKVSFAGFGVSGDIPVAGDWNGTGVVSIGVFRPGTGEWVLDLNNNGRWDGVPGDAVYRFGAAGDLPVVGDWNGDRRSKFGVFRPSTGQFILDTQGHRTFDATSTVYSFGANGDVPVAGNWSGTATADQIGIFRPSTGQWVLDSNGNGRFDSADTIYSFGGPGDLPVVGNWGSNPPRTRIGVFRPSAGQWILDTTGSGNWVPADLVFQFGASGDRPVVGFWTF